MLSPPFPPDEAARAQELENLHILDTPSEERFDRITRMAMRFFDVPVALVSLVDHKRQWFKSCQGLTVSETSREISFCGHAILSSEPLVVTDATQDPRFQDNPLVTGEPHVRFYAAIPSWDRKGTSWVCFVSSTMSRGNSMKRTSNSCVTWPPWRKRN